MATRHPPATTTASLSEEQVERALVRALRAWRERTYTRAEFAKRFHQLADQLHDTEKSTHAKQVRVVFEHWVSATGRDPERTKLTPTRRAKVVARLNEGYSLEEILQAVTNCAADPFVSDEGKVFSDLELICRNGAKLEQYRDAASLAPPEKPYVDPGF